MSTWLVPLATIAFVGGLLWLMLKMEQVGAERQKRKAAEAAAKASKTEAEIYAKPRPASWTDLVNRL